MRVTLSRPPAQVDFEVGSISEAVGILQSEESALVQLFTIADKMNGGGEEAEQVALAAEPKKERKTRAPKEAVAPPPMPVPSAAAPPSPPVAPVAPTPIDTTEGPNGVPKFLDRSGGAPAGQPLPPPAPPPLVPAAPNFALGNRVADVLEAKAATAADAGKSLVTWLQHPGLGGIVRNDPSVTFQEAVAVVRMTTDDRVAVAAGLLQVS